MGQTKGRARKARPKRKLKRKLKPHPAKSAEIPPVNTVQVGRLWGVRTPTVQGWLKEGCPRRKDGLMDLAAVIGWWRGKHEAAVERTREARGKAKSGHLERLRRVKADREELKLKQEKGELVSRRDVEKALLWRAQVTKTALTNLPRALAPLLADVTEAREVESMLEAKIREGVAEMLNGKLGTENDNHKES